MTLSPFGFEAVAKTKRLNVKKAVAMLYPWIEGVNKALSKFPILGSKLFVRWNQR
jgi:hypothetical protein